MHISKDRVVISKKWFGFELDVNNSCYFKNKSKILYFQLPRWTCPCLSWILRTFEYISQVECIHKEITIQLDCMLVVEEMEKLEIFELDKYKLEIGYNLSVFFTTFSSGNWLTILWKRFDKPWKFISGASERRFWVSLGKSPYLWITEFFMIVQNMSFQVFWSAVLQNFMIIFFILCIQKAYLGNLWRDIFTS